MTRGEFEPTREVDVTPGQAEESPYSEANIQALTASEAVRQRPALFIGDTTVRGLHHLVFELVDNSIREVLAGHAGEVCVTLHADGSASVVDDGPGIPAGPHPQYGGKDRLEVILTSLSA